MSSSVEDFQSILTEDLKAKMAEFRRRLEQTFESDSVTLETASKHLQENLGKQVRPLLLILVAGTYGVSSDEVLDGAVSIELLHTASLLHDDVVDASMMRRGQPSINALFGNKKAVLVGDFILSTAVFNILQTGNRQIVSRMAKMGLQLSEGELLQMDSVELGTFSEQEYYQIIDQKTASLIRVSMAVGALLAGETDEAKLAKIEEAGTKLGWAFQIKDDLFDYLPTKKMGKPAGADLREHKVTLPLIYAIELGGGEAEKVRKLLRHDTLTREQINYLVDFAIRKGGIAYAEQRIAELLTEAKDILKEVLAPGESLEMLLKLCDYIGERNR